MKFTPEKCPKCEAEVDPPSADGGRPTRWCSEGCKRAGEAEMSRLNTLLRKFTEGLYWERLNGRDVGVRPALLSEMQARYDHLAGVPKRDPR